ncbi:MAG: HAD family hydrolase [Acidobacteriaceae bacterium]|nr:HAD family hydrolase [Acidobacteriaceae bacterium]
MPELKTVFFDIGNTLLFPTRPVILKSLYQRNLAPTLEQWHAIERATKKEFDESMQHGIADHGFWFMFYTQLLAELGISDELLRDELVNATRMSSNWCDMRPGTRETLQRIGSRYPLAVISNADGKIAAVLERCGIAEWFASITDSGVVGCEKPAGAIFQAALRAMNAKPAESLYVGDVYSVDYLGATRAGMQAMLFDVSGAYRGLDVPRVASLEELEAHLMQ